MLRLGAAPSLRHGPRVFFAAALLSIIVGLVHWAVMGPFANAAVLWGAGVGAVVGIVASFLSSVAYEHLRPVVIDTATRVIETRGMRIPFALAGPIAVWNRSVNVSGGPEGSDSPGVEWNAHLVIGDDDAREALLLQYRARRDGDAYRSAADDNKISLEIQPTHLIPVARSTNHAAVVTAAAELVALWNNQITNTQGGPDFAKHTVRLNPSDDDLAALDAAQRDQTPL